MSCHGVPEQLLSELMHEVCKLLGTKKVNTKGYRLQRNGLVERMNWTLIGIVVEVCC